MENSTMPNMQTGMPTEGGKKTWLIVAVAVLILVLGAGYWWWQGRESADVVSEDVPGVENLSAPTNDTTAAIQSDLDVLDVGGLDQDFQQIDSDLNQL